MNTATIAQDPLFTTAVALVTAYVQNNKVENLPALIQETYNSLAGIGSTAQAPAVPAPQATQAPADASIPAARIQQPAVDPAKSVFPDRIICLEDGREFKMLKRHLGTAYNMTPDQYRAKWGLPADYPMTAPMYSKQKSQMAKITGLGTEKLGRPTRTRAH